MEPMIKELPGMKVVGIEYTGLNQNGEVQQLWEEFNSYMNEIRDKVEPYLALGVCTNMRPDGSYTYVAGYAVTVIAQPPPGMVSRSTPPARYAIFTHHGQLFDVPNDLHSTYNYIFTDWLPASGYTYSGSPTLEWYDTRFKLESDESELDICIPIK